MKELQEISNLLKEIGKRLETFSNSEKNYNHCLSEDLNGIGLDVCRMSEEINIIKEFFFGI